MKNVKIIFTVALVVVPLLVSGCGSGLEKAGDYHEQEKWTVKRSTGASANDYIGSNFVSPEVFAKTANIESGLIEGVPVAGIVNHHNLAMDLQAHFFATLKSVRPDIKTFIILSPDHYSAGGGISFHEFAYQTPAGVVEFNQNWIHLFNGVNAWRAESILTFAKEHGIGAIIPFVAREYPHAKIVPIYLHIDLDDDQAMKLGSQLAEKISDDEFLLISSDMSHYLIKDEAQKRDEQTLSWLRSNDFAELGNATDKNTDSAVAFTVLQAFFKQKGNKQSFELLDRAISTDYGGDRNNTTSYINGFYQLNGF